MSVDKLFGFSCEPHRITLSERFVFLKCFRHHCVKRFQNVWGLLQISNMCNNNNDWLLELHNGQISLSFIVPARNKLDCVDRMLWIIFDLEDYKLWFFQVSEREHIDIFDVFCGNQTGLAKQSQICTSSGWN